MSLGSITEGKPINKPLLWTLGALIGLAVAVLLSSLVLPFRTNVAFGDVTPFLTLSLLMQAKSAQTYWLLAESIGISVGIIAVAACAVWLIPRKRSLHGDAKWAVWNDIKKADPSLDGKKGIFLGEFKGR